jgi:hypothetical protein
MISTWHNSLLEIGETGFPMAVRSEGVFNSFIGSRPAYAKVELVFEPSEEFVFDSSVIIVEGEIANFLRGICHGVLDVLFAPAYRAPMFKTKVTVLSIALHDIESTEWSFRLAARDAARRALEQVPSRIAKGQENNRYIRMLPATRAADPHSQNEDS